MAESRPPDFLRAIPSVDEVLSHDRLAAWRDAHPRFPWTRLVRDVLDELRNGPPDGPREANRPALVEWTVDQAGERIAALQAGGQRPVLNGTGVVLHTNLGRAPLGERATTAALAAMRGYVSLEVDLESGERSRRAETLEELLCWLTGAEAAMVVNNNAAAVVLVASSFSPPGRVIISRGELVEIGGSFRLPEILRDAAAGVIEVGTTNRTYAADYERVARADDVLLKVHKSNYAIAGFAHEATLAEIVAVAREQACHAVYDMGSGAFFDVTGTGLPGADDAGAALAAGLDAVTMSGDKLLGGLQAGIIVGTRAFVDRLKQNPLRRAVRIDKVTVAALQEIVRSYLFADDPRAEIPSLAMITGDVSVRERARTVAEAVARQADAAFRVTAGDDDAVAGGGSLAGARIPSAAVVVGCVDERGATRLARRLRTSAPPLFGRVRDNEVRINMTTILSSEDAELVRVLREALAGEETG
jgi:L-seryl-tRNA(Ser) seleniumtransferase